MGFRREVSGRLCTASIDLPAPEVLDGFEGVVEACKRAKLAGCGRQDPESVVRESDKPFAPLPKIGINRCKLRIH
jgi:hypothetical protein